MPSLSLSRPASATRFARFSPRKCADALAAVLVISMSACSPSSKEDSKKAETNRLEALTGGHTRVVWVRNLADKGDMFTVGGRLQLMGLDSRDPKGPAPLLEEMRNYSRPMIAPDGASVVYTERPIPGKGNSAIFMVDWKERRRKPLRPGYALDVWRDAATGTVWVYALKGAHDLGTALPVGGPLIRFPLTDPQKEELIFDHNSLNVDNVQLNRAGTRASGLLPWPKSGSFELTRGTFQLNRQGCWPSMAPDDSGLTWVFDGAHQNLLLFAADQSASWRVPLSGAEGVNNESVYHPRWSNHPRVIAFSGPHIGGVEKNGSGVDIVLGRLSADCSKLEDSMAIPDGTPLSDYFPDVWVEGGEKASLALASAPTAAVPVAAPATEVWSPARTGLVFAWLSANSKAEIPVGNPPAVSVVAPVAGARFGPYFGMLLDSGRFQADAAAAKAFPQAVRSGIWSAEAAVTPLSTSDAEGVILQAGADLVLSQSGTALVVRASGKSWRADRVLSPGVTTHVVLSSPSRDAAPVLWIDGAPVSLQNEAPAPPAAAGAQGLTFGAHADGSASWHGWLEGIALRSTTTGEQDALASAGWWKRTLAARQPIPRTVVEAKVLQAGRPKILKDLGAYSRSWTASLFEQTKLVSGPDPGKTFTVARWSILDKTPLADSPPAEETTVLLELEPFAAYPGMSSEDGSAEVCPDGGMPDFLDSAPVKFPGTAK